MKWTTHVLYLVVIFTLFNTSKDYKKSYYKYMNDYYEVYDQYLDLKLKDNEAMKGWSLCLSEKADETHSKTICDNQLYDLRNWLRKCQCKCTGFRGK